MKPVIQNAPFIESFDEFKSYIMKESGIEGEPFLKSLRLLLTGAEYGPEVSDMYPFLKDYLPEIIK